MKQVQPPDAIEKSFMRVLQRRLRALVRALQKGDMAEYEVTHSSEAPTIIKRIGDRVQGFTDRQIASLAVDPKKVKDALTGVSLGNLVNNWALLNVVKINGLEASLIRSVQEILTAGTLEGRSTEDIAKDIARKGQMTITRGRLIARTEINKLNAQLSAHRQKGLGMKQYRWVTSGDRRVRPEHAHRHGKVYNWSNPPKGGHPGEAPYCRCIATPIIPKSLDLFHDR